MSEITSGLHKGIYHQGKLRVNRYNGFEATVSTESLGQEILIHGRIDMNRGFDGDVVAVELLPQEQWQENSLGKIVEDGPYSNYCLYIPITNWNRFAFWNSTFFSLALVEVFAWTNVSLCIFRQKMSKSTKNVINVDCRFLRGREYGTL